MKTEISKLISDNVKNYRQAARSAKENPTKSAHKMMKDRASGALDALFILDPKNTAWKRSGWTS